jgi:HEAT repeat protein
MMSELLVQLQTGHPDFIEDRRFQHIYLNHLKWTEPIALMLAELEDETQALRIVRLALEIDFVLGSRLAGAVQPKFQAQTVAMVRDLAVPKWLKLELLGKTKSDAALPDLLNAIVDQDANIRSIAATALGEIGNPAALPSLMNALTDEHTIRVDEWGTTICDVRWVVEKALEKFDPDAVIPYLMTALNSNNMDLRYQSIEVLSKLRIDASIPALIDALEHEDEYVRYSAAKALGIHGAEIAIPNLISTLTDESINVRGHVIEALGKLNTEAAIPDLIHALGDESERVSEKLGKTTK